MSKINCFEELTIWKESVDLVNQIYEITKERPFSRDYQLIDQIRRSVVSIPSNISEGFERDGKKEFINFLSIAKGSCGELRTQLHIAFNQKYIDEQKFNLLHNRARALSKSISALMKYLRDSDYKGHKFR
jgi:four helix bundle protein